MKRIFVRGGDHANRSRFWNYLVAQTGVPHPRILVITTAGGNSDFWYRKVAGEIIEAQAFPSSLSLFEPVPRDLTAHLMQFNAIFVTGGNTRSELALWRFWGLDNALKSAYEGGVILSGFSAGGICWFENGTTDSWADAMGKLEDGLCLGFLKGSHSPHYDAEPGRRPMFQALVAQGELPNGLAIDNPAIAIFEDGTLTQVFTLEEGKTAYTVIQTAPGKVEETPLPATLLT